MVAIILAGGLGTRLRSVVPELPKPLADVRGKPFICYLMDYWLKEGVDHFILSVGYKHELIQNQLGTRYRGIRVSYEVEGQPLGTGGALLQAMNRVETQSLVLALNGDTFFAVKLDALKAAHHDAEADMTLSLVEVEGDSRYSGIQLDEKGFVSDIDPRSISSSSRFVNGGVYLLEPKSLNAFRGQKGERLSLEDEILPGFINSEQRLLGFVSQGVFVDIGIPEDYRRAGDILSFCDRLND